jgi:diguanylate cyclase (GGDEF)-like protein/PAS domain S-box-containing protein
LSEANKHPSARPQRRERSYESLFELNPHAIFELDESGFCRHMNRAAKELTGYDPAESENRLFSSSLDERAQQTFAEALRRAVAGETVHFEAAMTHRYGRVVELHVTLLPLGGDAAGEGAYAIAQDITQRRHNERTINHMAYHDALTELPNRRLFQKRLAALLDDIRSGHASAADASDSFAVLLVDLDGFKAVNDSLGHAVGDETIRFAAMRLKRCIREEDLVARIGGDEFVVILCNLEAPQQAAEIAERIIGELSKSFFVHGHSVTLSASIGIALYPDDGQDADSLLRTADAAMYRVKEQGKNDYAFAVGRYEPIAFNSLLGMREALADGQFFVHYQPLIDTAAHRPIGFEALPRWRPEDGRLLLPDQFIPIAEANGFISELSAWVLRTACRQLLRWQQEWSLPLWLSVNMSIRQLSLSDTAATILSVLGELRFPPSLLSIEINETELLLDTERAVLSLQVLTEAGVQITIDDFGAGSSVFHYLQRFPVRTIKLDRSLIRKLSGEKETAIVSAVVHLAERLGLTLIVEGVETSAQREALPGLGCRFMQGFYFGMPQPADGFSPEVWSGV